MQIVLITISLLLLLVVFKQDIKYRAVSWILFPSIALTDALLIINHSSLEFWIIGFLQSILFLLIVLTMIGVWLVIRNINIRSLFKEYLGIGDVIFFFVMAFSIPFPDFAVVFVISLLVSLIIALIFFRGKLVPLAGLQALLLIPYLLFAFVSEQQVTDNLII